MHFEHLTYDVSYKGGWVALWTPRLVDLKATSTVTPRACPHKLVVESYSWGINIKGCLEMHKQGMSSPRRLDTS